jgi:hypothetical protein
MSRSCSRGRARRHRVTFAGPIDSESDALAVLEMGAPYDHDTIAILLDAERRGIGAIVVTDTFDPDALFTVIDVCVAGPVLDVDAVILATSRPGGDMTPADLDRWFEAATQCNDAGIELVEWFVLGTRVERPRELAGDPPRWGTR